MYEETRQRYTPVLVGVVGKAPHLKRCAFHDYLIHNLPAHQSRRLSSTPKNARESVNLLIFCLYFCWITITVLTANYYE